VSEVRCPDSVIQVDAAQGGGGADSSAIGDDDNAAGRHLGAEDG
jgi:hypothetical protein